MICCRLQDFKRYLVLSPNFKAAIKYILSTDLNALSFGITNIKTHDIHINKVDILIFDNRYCKSLV